MQILMNFLSNAIKFTNKNGQVSISVDIMDRQIIEHEPDKMWVQLQISVIDTGIGISEEGRKKLFIDFGKLDENSMRNRQGTGLGLSICKKIIEQMGGHIKVESKIGVGTEFIINVKTKCKIGRVNQMSCSISQEFFESVDLHSLNPVRYTFMGKDNKESQIKNFIR